MRKWEIANEICVDEKQDRDAEEIEDEGKVGTDRKGLFELVTNTTMANGDATTLI